MRTRALSANASGGAIQTMSSTVSSLDSRDRSQSVVSPHSSIEMDLHSSTTLAGDEKLDKTTLQQPHLPEGGRASNANATMNFINSTVGAGIIGLPFALRRTGMISGVLLLVLVAALTDYGCRLLLQSGIKAKKKNLETLCKHVFGPKGYYAALSFMAMLGFGAMIVFLIVIGDTVPQVARNEWSSSYFTDRTFTILVFSIVAILPLSLFRDMATLGMASTASILAVVVMLCTVIARGPTVGRDPERYDQEAMFSDNPYAFIKPTFFGGIGSMSFALVCNHSSFIVFNSLKSPTMKNWTIVTHASVACSMLLSLTMALFGYCSFLGNTKSDILNNFSYDDDAINVSRILLAFTMMFSYPMEIFVVRHCIIESVFGGSKSLFHHIVSTLLLWVVSVAIAVGVEDLGIMLELTGALSASCLGYILPPLCYISVFNQKIRDEFAQVWARSPSGGYKTPNLITRLFISIRCTGPFVMVCFGVITMFAGTVSAFV